MLSQSLVVVIPSFEKLPLFFRCNTSSLSLLSKNDVTLFPLASITVVVNAILFGFPNCPRFSRSCGGSGCEAGQYLEFVCWTEEPPNKRRKRGRKAATLPTKIPTPGSTQVQIARRAVTARRSLAVLLDGNGGRQLGMELRRKQVLKKFVYAASLRALMYGIRMKLVIPPLVVVSRAGVRRRVNYMAPRPRSPATEYFIALFILRFHTFTYKFMV
jgi:hypothetical protein